MKRKKMIAKELAREKSKSNFYIYNMALEKHQISIFSLVSSRLKHFFKYLFARKKKSFPESYSLYIFLFRNNNRNIWIIKLLSFWNPWAILFFFSYYCILQKFTASYQKKSFFFWKIFICQRTMWKFWKFLIQQWCSIIM